MPTTPATQTTPPTAAELWVVIKKEITGIQLLWETVNGLYFQQQGKEWRTLGNDTPLLIRLTQTALIESLLMRVSRLMDPATTGRGQSQMTNLSLKRLVEVDSSIPVHETVIRGIWDESELKAVRDKYLSHNDLQQALSEEHTLNIPLNTANIEALKKLTKGLRVFRRDVNQKLSGCTYIDQGLDLKIQNEIETLGCVIAAGNQFLKESPDLL